MTDLTGEWQMLGRVTPARLMEARLQLHWAVQVPAAAAVTVAAPAADDSHLALAWDEENGALLTVPLPGGRRAGLILATAELVMTEESGALGPCLGVHGKTLAETLAWLNSEAGGGRSLERPGHEMPAHGVGTGQPFNLEGLWESTAELSAWYADASLVLEKLVADRGQASPVRCWPHHFDLATLEVLDAGADPEKARSVGIGMTPGDGGLPDPYFYVLPWPRPQVPDLPALAGEGQWHTGDWLAAVLHASAIRLHPAPGDQAGQVEDFLASARSGALQLLNG